MKNLSCYNLEGTVDINGNRQHITYQSKKTWPTYQLDFDKFKNNILKWSQQEKAKVLLRVYDGEFWFLRNTKIGNVGKRHVSKKINSDFTKRFLHNSLKCDSLSSHLTVLPRPDGKVGSMAKLYRSVYGNRKIDYPMEFHYAIVLNKWIFNNFKNQIGLIGGVEKIKVIKNLMTHQSYRDYLGMDYFTEYISIPEKFSCDHPEKLLDNLQQQLIKCNPSTKIFLFGMGISKLFTAYKLKEFFPAIYIDAGRSFSALAGFVSKYRPYAAGWKNFRITNYDYSKIDKMDTNDKENIVFL